MSDPIRFVDIDSPLDLSAPVRGPPGTTEEKGKILSGSSFLLRLQSVSV